MPKRTLILGTSPLARKLAAEIGSQLHSGYSIIGVIGENSVVTWTQVARYPLLGVLKDLQQIIADHKPDRIIVALDERSGCLHADQLIETQIHSRLMVETGVDAYERLTGKLAIESLVPGNVLFSSEFRHSRYMLWFARVSSVLVACIGLLLFLPLMVAVGLAIKLTSAGPILFIQERVGLGGAHFKLLKFRSMRDTAADHSEWARDNSDRITPLGRILRKFRLDELPQFINVIRGDMNIIGPRPHPVTNGELFTLVSRNTPECGDQIPYYTLRSSIRPGITGWAQVRYKYANGLDEEMEKLRYDLYYIKHYSLLLDLRILFETVKVVLLGHESDIEPALHTMTDRETRPEAVRRELIEMRGVDLRRRGAPRLESHRQRTIRDGNLFDENVQSRP